MLGIHYRPCTLVKQENSAVDGVRSCVFAEHHMTINSLMYLSMCL